MCNDVYGTVHYKEPFKSFEKSWAYSRHQASFCRDIATIVQKATYRNIHSLTSPWFDRSGTINTISRRVFGEIATVLRVKQCICLTVLAGRPTTTIILYCMNYKVH